MNRWALIKNRIVCILFPALLGLGLLLHILLPDAALSYTERRQLQQLPPLTAQSLFAGNWTQDWENYLLDQFPAREGFRAVKSLVHYRVFRQLDKEGIYLQGQHIFQQEYPLQEESVQAFAQKLNALYEAHMQDSRVYLAIIPDKSQYTKTDTQLRLPYAAMEALAKQGLHANIQYIPIRDCLELEAYYRTDLHWRQECIFPVVERLAEHMGFVAGKEGLREEAYTPFFGAYYGQAALPGLQPDTLVYLKSDVLEAAYVEDIQHPDLHGVYYEEGLGGMDSYDVFLHGATPLVSMQDPIMDSGRELVIFRDSFGSSIAPLLLPGYAKVTLVDLRYMSSALLEEYVDLQGKDILFLYGEQIVNNSNLLR